MNRKRFVILVVGACLILVLVLAVMRMTQPGREAADSSERDAAAKTACKNGWDWTSSCQDLYKRAMSFIRGPVVLPRVIPPDLKYFTVTSVDGEQLFSAQHSNVEVMMCRPDPGCGEAWAVPIRTVETPTGPFVIKYQALSKLPATPPPLNDALIKYWSSVDFEDRRPLWLTPALYPGAPPSAMRP